MMLILESNIGSHQAKFSFPTFLPLPLSYTQSQKVSWYSNRIKGLLKCLAKLVSFISPVPRITPRYS